MCARILAKLPCTYVRGAVGYSARLAGSWTILAMLVFSYVPAVSVIIAPYIHPRTVEAFLVAKILFGEPDGEYEIPTVYNEKIGFASMLAYYHAPTNSISMDVAEVEAADAPADMVFYVLVHEIAHSILQQDGIPIRRHHEIIYPMLICEDHDVTDLDSPAADYLGRWPSMAMFIPCE